MTEYYAVCKYKISEDAAKRNNFPPETEAGGAVFLEDLTEEELELLKHFVGKRFKIECVNTWTFEYNSTDIFLISKEFVDSTDNVFQAQFKQLCEQYSSPYANIDTDVDYIERLRCCKYYTDEIRSIMGYNDKTQLSESSPKTKRTKKPGEYLLNEKVKHMLALDMAMSSLQMEKILGVARQTIAKTNAWKENQDRLKAIKAQNASMMKEKETKFDYPERNGMNLHKKKNHKAKHSDPDK